MNGRLVLVILLTLSPITGAAQWGGAIGGAADAIQGISRQMMDYELQRQLMREQHEFEMERIEREHDMRMEALRREEARLQEIEQQRRRREQQAEADRRGQEQLRAYREQVEQAERTENERKAAAARRAAEEEAKLESKHPRWKELVRTKGFTNWHSRQPESVQRLAASERAEDAILLLDLYKRDRQIK